MDIKIGVPVRAEDGQAGKVERIILHPATNELEAVVAIQGGMLTRDVVIPKERIVSGTEEHVLVRGSVEEINNLTPFALSQYAAPPADWIPPGELPASVYLFPESPVAVGAFDRGSASPPPPAHQLEDLEPGDVDVSGSTRVYSREGKVAGKLDRVITMGDSDRVSHLVIRHGGLPPRDLVVPVEHVGQIAEDGVTLTLSEDQIDDLPDFDERVLGG